MPEKRPKKGWSNLKYFIYLVILVFIFVVLCPPSPWGHGVVTRGEGDGGVAWRGPWRGRSPVPALPAGGPASPSPSVAVVVHPRGGGLGVVVGGVVAAAAGSPVVVGRGVAAAPGASASLVATSAERRKLGENLNGPLRK